MAKAITLESATKNIKIIYNYFKLALESIETNPSVLDIYHNFTSTKTDTNSNLEYDISSKIISRNRLNDRTFPVETISLKKHELEHEELINTAMIHTGSYADELARSFYALAFTIGRDIFFRNGNYKPETEEGRVLLAHELKHVSQFEENPSEDNRTQNELEQQAVLEEKKETYNPEKFKEIEYNGKRIRVLENVSKKIDEESDRILEQWIEEQEYQMPKDEYLELLDNYEKYLDSRA